MKKSTFIKSSSLLIVGILTIATVNAKLLLGVVKADKVNTARMRGVNEQAELKAPKPGVAVDSLTVKAENPSSYFKIGEDITVRCKIKNTSDKETIAISSLIRTQHETVTSKKNKLAPNEEVVISGTFTPKNTGLTYLACRNDKTTAKAVTALYIFE